VGRLVSTAVGAARCQKFKAKAGEPCVVFEAIATHGDVEGV